MRIFQQGGQAPQEDAQQQIVALVQAAAQGDQQAQQTIQQIQQAAQQGDQQAQQLLQLIQQIMEQMQGQAQSARMGAKLQYLRSLRGECPEGYQMGYFKKGGTICKKCVKKDCSGAAIKAFRQGTANKRINISCLGSKVRR